MPRRGFIIINFKLLFIKTSNFQLKLTIDYLNKTLFTILKNIPCHVTPRPLKLTANGIQQYNGTHY